MGEVTNLPPRRGPADGGIDGILYTSVIGKDEELSETALSIKIESTKFNKDQLYVFKGNMERENINVGIVVTKEGLSPDAKPEKERINQNTDITIGHVLLANIIEGTIDAKNIKINPYI